MDVRFYVVIILARNAIGYRFEEIEIDRVGKLATLKT